MADQRECSSHKRIDRYNDGVNFDSIRDRNERSLWERPGGLSHKMMLLGATGTQNCNCASNESQPAGCEGRIDFGGCMRIIRVVMAIAIAITVAARSGVSDRVQSKDQG